MIQKILKTILGILVVIFIFLGIVFNFEKLNDRSEVPKISGFSLLCIDTDGMTTTAKKGDFVLLKEVTNYQAGDVVIYQDGKSNHVSKVIEVQKEYYVLKQETASETVTVKPDAMIGKIIFDLPNAGGVWNFLIHPIITGLLVVFSFGYLLQKLVTQ